MQTVSFNGQSPFKLEGTMLPRIIAETNLDVLSGRCESGEAHGPLGEPDPCDAIFMVLNLYGWDTRGPLVGFCLVHVRPDN
jgi:hypothetical protein